MTDVEDRLNSIEEKLDQVIQHLEKVKNSSSTKAPRKKPTTSKVEQFKVSTQDLLDSSDPLCAYMQRSEDCEGHCGKPGTFSVIRDRPENLDDLDDLEEPKNERAAMLRKSFLRCNGCKSKAQKAENSRAYKVIKKHLYKQTGEDTAVAADIDAMMGSPSKKKAKKGKGKKSAAKTDSDDEADVQEGLDDPEDSNENLLKNEKWSDKFVKVGKKNMIVRSYKDKRKKPVCIGLIDGEPEDDQYEESLRKPSKTFLDKVGLKYVTPEDAAKGTPPKAPMKGKKGSSAKSNSDDSDSEEEEEEASKTKTKTKRKTPSSGKKAPKGKDDSDSEDEEEKETKKGKAASRSKKAKAPKGKADSDSEEEEAPKGKAKKAKAKKGKSKADSDEDEDDEDGEAEAFRDMADSD